MNIKYLNTDIRKKIVRLAKNAGILLLIYLSIWLLEKNHLLRCSILDDLNFFKNFCDNGFWGSVFSGGYKFRPVSNGALWMAAEICQKNIYLYGYLNVFINAIATFLVYIFINENSKSQWYGVVGALLYMTSRFSYYQITTQIGVMETVSTILFILIIRNLYIYMKDGDSKYYCYALISYGLCSMSHERYTIMFPILIYAWFVTEGQLKKQTGRRKYGLLIGTICEFAIIMLIFKLMVADILMGTGGQSVSSTFSVTEMLKNVAKSVGYLLGVNGSASDIYLTMVAWSAYTVWIKGIVIASIVCAGTIIIVGVLDILKNIKLQERKKQLCIMLFFILSIGAMVLISSATIRVELRWMYAPYTAVIALLIYTAQLETDRKKSIVKDTLLIIYFVGMIFFNMFSRNFYSNLYYWGNYTIANALTDSTYARYGDDMYSKSWVIITDVQPNNAFEDLMKQYDVYDEYELKVQVIASVNELENIQNLENKEVLFWDKTINQFINLTNVIKNKEISGN